MAPQEKEDPLPHSPGLADLWWLSCPAVPSAILLIYNTPLSTHDRPFGPFCLTGKASHMATYVMTLHMNPCQPAFCLGKPIQNSLSLYITLGPRAIRGFACILKDIHVLYCTVYSTALLTKGTNHVSLSCAGHVALLPIWKGTTS